MATIQILLCTLKARYDLSHAFSSFFSSSSSSSRCFNYCRTSDSSKKSKQTPWKFPDIEQKKLFNDVSRSDMCTDHRIFIGSHSTKLFYVQNFLLEIKIFLAHIN
jgi:hypothetical protein